MEKKQCSKCDQKRSRDDFFKDPRRRDGLQSWCKPCVRVYARQRRARNPEAASRAYRQFYLRWKYGLSQEKYDALLLEQDRKCAACGIDQEHAKRPGVTRSKKNHNYGLVVDHDHVTNKVRGLLCNRCNRILGLVEDRQEVLVSLLEYLRLRVTNAPQA